MGRLYDRWIMYLNKAILMAMYFTIKFNPSYSGGSNQEDCSWKQAQANSLREPISKKPITKKD
jgi:hypothetical protein